MDRKGVAERFAALGFGCDIWTDGPGQVWADFVHDVDEIVMLIGRDRGLLRGEDAPSRAGRGDRDPGGCEPHRQKHRKDYEPLVLRLPPGSRTALPPSAGQGGVTLGKNAL
jgi:hypothetical protein